MLGMSSGSVKIPVPFEYGELWSMPKTNGLSRRSELIQKTVAYVAEVTNPSDLSGYKKSICITLAHFTINYF